jgi:hypothetical protein
MFFLLKINVALCDVLCHTTPMRKILIDLLAVLALAVVWYLCAVLLLAA